MAADMAKEFGYSRWEWLAGLWHDLGNYSRDFQEITKRNRLYNKKR